MYLICQRKQTLTPDLCFLQSVNEQSANQSHVVDLLCVMVHVAEIPLQHEAAARDLPAGDSGTLLTTFAQSFFYF